KETAEHRMKLQQAGVRAKELAAPSAPSPVKGLALFTFQAERELATLPTFAGFFKLMGTPDGDGTGLLQAARQGNQETAVRKLAQPRTAHLPPGQLRYCRAAQT